MLKAAAECMTEWDFYERNCKLKILIYSLNPIAWQNCTNGIDSAVIKKVFYLTQRVYPICKNVYNT